MAKKLFKRKSQQDEMTKKFILSSQDTPLYDQYISMGIPQELALNTARELENEFGETGVYDMGTLPELVIKPGISEKKSLRKFKKMFPNKMLRLNMYQMFNNSNISLNEGIDRLYEVYQKSRLPKLSTKRNFFNKFTSLFKKENIDRANYDPSTNTITIPEKTAPTYISELSHAYLHYSNDPIVKKKGLNSWWGQLKNLFYRFIPSEVSLEYYTPGTVEHSAHSIIEPAITDYIDGRTNNLSDRIEEIASQLSGGILQFLKNGSGIHIKKENRGKFTDYCGGKVTSECIAKGKRSSNPAIRKRATFAANARKWKHKFGGLINYAADGDNTLNWWLRNSGTINTIGNAISETLPSIVNSILKKRTADLDARANEISDNISELELFNKYYAEEMSNFNSSPILVNGLIINLSPMVALNKAYQVAWNKAKSEMLSNRLKTKLKNAKLLKEANTDLTNSIMGTVGNFLLTGIGMLANRTPTTTLTTNTMIDAVAPLNTHNYGYDYA